MPVEVRRAVTINRPRSETYAFWRQLENLPRFMLHLESVTEIDDKRSHWVAKAPAGSTVEWDAETVQEVRDEYLAWRSMPDADVPNRGEVRFTDAPAGRGTEVHALFTYDPPGGGIGAAVAKLFREDADTETREALRNFKRILETGEIPTTEGQPAGRKPDAKDKSKDQTHGDAGEASPAAASSTTRGEQR